MALAADTAPTRTTAWTAEFLIRTSTPGGTHRYAEWITRDGGASGWYVSISAAGVVAGWLDDHDKATAVLSSLSGGYGDNVWHRIRVTHDGLAVSLYIDGVLQQTAPTTIAAGVVTERIANPSGDAGLSGGLRELTHFVTWGGADPP